MGRVPLGIRKRTLPVLGSNAQTPRCVAESKFASHFLGPILNPFRNPQGKTVYLPWHDLRSEVNKILSFMGLPAW